MPGGKARPEPAAEHSWRRPGHEHMALRFLPSQSLNLELRLLLSLPPPLPSLTLPYPLLPSLLSFLFFLLFFSPIPTSVYPGEGSGKFVHDS